MMTDVNLVAERAQVAIKKAVADERKALAAAMCSDCRRGDVPTYNASVNHYYHQIDEDEEIGCSASVVHHRARSDK